MQIRGSEAAGFTGAMCCKEGLLEMKPCFWGAAVCFAEDGGQTARQEGLVSSSGATALRLL